MTMTRKTLCWLGALALGAWLCVPAHAQYVGKGEIVDESTESGAVQGNIVQRDITELRAQSNARTAPMGDGCGCGGGFDGGGCGGGCVPPGTAFGTFVGTCNLGDSCGECCECCECCCGCPRWYASYENVWLQPHFSRNAAFYNDDATPGLADFNEIPFDWEHDYSPRFELGYLHPCGLGVRARYWKFDDTTTLLGVGNDSLHASFSGGDDDATIDIDEADTILAAHRLRLQVVDVEGTKSWDCLLFSAGWRYVQMYQAYSGVSTGSDDTDVIVGQHRFHGHGLTAALDFVQPVTTRLSAFAKARGSLLYGESNFNAFGIDGGAVDGVLLRRNANDLISITELQAGIDWRYAMQSGSAFYVTAAVECQYWTSGGTALPERHGNDDGNYNAADPQEADMGLWGFNLGVGYIF